MGAAQGWKAKIGLGTSIPTTLQLEFQSEGIKLVETQSDLSGLRGTRGRPDGRVRTTQNRIGGPISCQPTPTELNWLLPRILGGTEVSDTFPLAELLPSFALQVDRDAKVFNYTGMMVDTATFSSSVGSALALNLDLLGMTEAVANAGTFPALSPIEEQPYVLSDATVSIGGNAYQFASVDVTIANALSAQYFNSVNPTRINPTDRTVVYTLSLPYGDATALYGAAGPVAVVLTCTNGSNVLTFTSSKVRAPKDSPTVGSSRDEIPLNWVGVARLTSSDQELVVTNAVA